MLRTSGHRSRYPDNFKGPRGLRNYETCMDPETWLDDYETTMEMRGASPLVATRYLPLMMGGSTHNWVHNLPRGSINSWKDMRDTFIKYFGGMCQRPATVEDLQRCTQKDGESTRQWLWR